MKIFVLAVTALAFASNTSVAQPSVSQKPRATHTQGALQFGAGKCNGHIDVEADNFVGNFETKIGTYIGNVVVTQASCKLRADKVIAEAVEGNNLNRLTATGNVVFDSSSGTATGDNGVYDMGPKTVTLTGKKVVLVKGKNVMRGTILVVDLNTGLAHLTAKGMPGGRVHGSFVPKSGGNDGTAPNTSVSKTKDNGDN